MFFDMKRATIGGEALLLRKLGFNVNVQLPYGILVNYLQILEVVDNAELAQRAWNYLNDSFRSIVSIAFQPSTLAAAAIWLAARHLNERLPDSQPWWDLFDVDLQDIKCVARQLVYLYEFSANLYPLPSALPLSTQDMKTLIEKVPNEIDIHDVFKISA